ncbi:5253_t:CDS:2 [Paraglomus brasilianum]|uniref:5253_t:CDS:1 n=1 Tax=Paraglomus brasilianum TaxID=144538 RepID=A0A9N9AWH8_9GLOM|nr:5253_t:CDS:2 [Paraglomus brasilianum]
MNRSLVGLFFLAFVVCSVLADTFTINVAPGGANKFDPATTNAKVGDTIQFSFQSGRNSVVEASNSTSCIPLPGGIDSTVKNSGDTFQLTLTDAKQTINFYNGVNNLCSAGMRGSITVQGAKAASTDGSSGSSSDGSGSGGSGGASAATSSSIVSYGVLVASAIVAVFASF